MIEAETLSHATFQTFDLDPTAIHQGIEETWSLWDKCNLSLSSTQEESRL